MTISNETKRLIRHGLAPLAAYGVAEGWLPASMQHELVELVVVLVALAIPYAWSWWREVTQ